MLRTVFFALLFCSTTLLSAQQASLPELEDWVEQDYSYLKDLYIHCHQNPELSFYEFNTARRMAAELREAGFEVTEEVGKTGVVGVLKNGEGPTVLVRTDLDALPVVEDTGLEYASTVTTEDESGKTVGVMHACGHDIHMTVWTGTARALAHLKDKWQGTIVFIGQPAEERGGGARDMLADGLFERFPRPDYCLALHVSADMPAGVVGTAPGYIMANVDMADITVHGRGGHGAAPHQTVDPVLIASRIVLGLQTIVSRELNPQDPAVVTVGAIHGGSKGNVIPEEVKLQLTIRSYSQEVRTAIIEKIQRICDGIAASAGLPEEKYPTVKVRDEYTPSLYNDPELTEKIRQAFTQVLDTEQVVSFSAEMIGEDFARYGMTEPRIPISMYRLGTVEKQTYAEAKEQNIPLPSLHSAQYAPDPEPSIKTGVLSMSAAVLRLLGK